MSERKALTSSPESPSRRPLCDVAAAPDYLDNIRNVVVRMQKAHELSDLVRLLNEATARLGADHAYFATYVRDDHGFGPCRTLLACDPHWALEYERGGHFAADPWLEYCATHAAPARDRDIDVITSQERSTVVLAGRFGFASAVVVPTPAGGGSNRVGAFVIGSPDRYRFDDAGYGAFRMAARMVARPRAFRSRRIRSDVWCNALERALARPSANRRTAPRSNSSPSATWDSTGYMLRAIATSVDVVSASSLALTRAAATRYSPAFIGTSPSTRARASRQRFAGGRRSPDPRSYVASLLSACPVSSAALPER